MNAYQIGEEIRARKGRIMNHPWYANTTGAATTYDTWTAVNYTTNTTATTAQTITVNMNDGASEADLKIWVDRAIHALKEYEARAAKTFNYPPPAPPVPKPPRRPAGFNRYLNASDLLEEFIRYAGAEGVRQGDVLGLPIELLVKWLVIRACEEEDEDPGVTLELPARAQPRCLGCQRWMRRGTVVPLHGERCAGRYFARAAA